MSHGKHTETAQFFRRVEDDRREPGTISESIRYIGRETNSRNPISPQYANEAENSVRGGNTLLPRGHFGVETDLDTSLDLVLAFDQQVEKLLRVDHRFAEISHETDQGGVPFVDDLERWKETTNSITSRLKLLALTAECRVVVNSP